MFLCLRHMAVQLVPFQVERGEKVAHPVLTCIGGRQTMEVLLFIPAFPFMWLDRKSPKLIDADHPPFFWWFVVELLDSFF